MKINKGNTGRIAERIVANELEIRGFLVRDLNREGAAANADLLAVKDGTTWFIQVKGCLYDHSSDKGDPTKNLGWWFQYGFCSDEHIVHRGKMFNHVEQAFYADVVILVCIRAASDYRCIVMPVDKAEEAAQINLDYAYRTTKKDGSKKTGSMVWTAFYIPRTTPEKEMAMRREQEILRQFHSNEDKWELDPAWSVSSPRVKR